MLLKGLFGVHFYGVTVIKLTEMTRLVAVTRKRIIKQNLEELARNVKGIHP